MNANYIFEVSIDLQMGKIQFLLSFLFSELLIDQAIL